MCHCGDGAVTRLSLVTRYSAFALVATLVNLATQRVVLSFGEEAAVFVLAVFLGTLTGLVLKYVLDKRWIFDDRSTGLAAHGRKFSIYTAMGLVTTAIFWGSETAFWLAFETDAMREVGAVLCLAVGYFVKYRLDRSFVFTDAALARVA